jgi:hypothetical protein
MRVLLESRLSGYLLPLTLANLLPVLVFGIANLNQIIDKKLRE